MTTTELRTITRAVIRRAQRQGSVSEGDIRGELKEAGLARTHWKDVVAQARGELSYRDGQYWYVAPDPGVEEEQRHQQEVARAVRRLFREHRKAAGQADRRREGRVDFVQSVQVRTEDGRTFTLLSRDISPTGIRLIGVRSFLGQKVQVRIAHGEGGATAAFVVRILWAGTVGDGLFENGGAFVELAAETRHAPATANGHGVHALA